MSFWTFWRWPCESSPFPFSSPFSAVPLDVSSPPSSPRSSSRSESQAFILSSRSVKDWKQTNNLSFDQFPHKTYVEEEKVNPWTKVNIIYSFAVFFSSSSCDMGNLYLYIIESRYRKWYFLILQPIVPLYVHPCWPRPASSRCGRLHTSSSPPPTHSLVLPIPPPAAVTAGGNRKQKKRWNDCAEAKQEDRKDRKAQREYRWTQRLCVRAASYLSVALLQQCFLLSSCFQVPL